jgi:hypothetical protein
MNNTTSATPKVGDILVSQWGYEANIATFAKVIAVTAKSVKLIGLGQTRTYSSQSDWLSQPDLAKTNHKVMTRRFNPSGHYGYSVKDSSFSTFFPWDGKPVACYNYH